MNDAPEPGAGEKSEAFRAGMSVRRAVLGDAHVDAATGAPDAEPAAIDAEPGTQPGDASGAPASTHP